MTDAASPAPSRAIAKTRTPGLPYLNVQIGVVIVAILSFLQFLIARDRTPAK